MNQHLKNLLVSSSFCLILATSSIACEKHQANQAEDAKQTVAVEQSATTGQAEDTTQSAAIKKNKRADYSKITKTVSDSVKKEVDGYYSAIDGEYNKLSDDAKKAIAKISNHKKNTFAKKGKDAKKKNSNS